MLIEHEKIKWKQIMIIKSLNTEHIIHIKSTWNNVKLYVEA